MKFIIKIYSKKHVTIVFFKNDVVFFTCSGAVSFCSVFFGSVLWFYQVLVWTNFYHCADIKNFEAAKEKFVYVVEDRIYYSKERREKTYQK